MTQSYGWGETVPWPSLGFVVLLLVLFFPCVAVGFQLLLAYGLSKSSSARKQTLLRKFDENEGSTEDIRNTFSGVSDEDLNDMREARERHKLATDSDTFKTTCDEVFRHLASTPRNAKRVINRIRLQLFILRRSGRLEGADAIRPGQLARWVVLEERWPEFTEMTKNKPDIAKVLKNAIDNGYKPREKNPVSDELKTVLAIFGPAYLDDRDFFKFMTDNESIIEDIDTFVNFEWGKATAENTANT